MRKLSGIKFLFYKNEGTEKLSRSLSNLQSSLNLDQQKHLYTWFVHIFVGTNVFIVSVVKRKVSSVKKRLPNLELKTLNILDTATFTSKKQ